MLRRVLISGAMPATSLVCAARAMRVHQPKADICLGRWELNREYDEMRNRSGRVEDHNIAKYRKMYFRFDELCRRQEKYMQDQGFFYLPTLDFYIYKGCLPLFSAEQMRLHYGRHHKAYVDKLNTLIQGTRFFGLDLDEIVRSTAEDDSSLGKQLFNNAAQHWNHMFFWKCIQPWGSIIPPDLAAAIERQYGSVDSFKAEMASQAMGFFGSGWMWFVYHKSAQKFDIIQTSNAQTPLTMGDVVPLLTLDMWEHTWYADYQNEKARYVANYWRAVDWHWAERHWKRATGQPFH